MFTCSICDETFVGDLQHTTYTTPCGHVFHYNCLTTWLDRAQTCPQCRSSVSKEDLIKLFLQVDPSARITWNKKIEEELVSLNKQLTMLRAKEMVSDKALISIETERKRLQLSIDQYRVTAYNLKHKNDLYTTQINEYKDKLEKLNIEINLIKEKQKNVETQYSLEMSNRVSLERNLYELQAVNSVVIEKLKFEIADLKSEKAYYQRRCQSLENGNNDPSEIQMKNKEVSSTEMQINNEFYSHSLKLSSKKFLLGCIFLIVDDQYQYEDICNDTAMFKLNIIENGGLVEQLYSSRITHLICVTQKNSLVEQAIKDGIRCVTHYWLTDTIAKKNMLPPWLAHHFPIPYSNETGLPCQQLQIAIANFDVNEHLKVKTMIELTGANVVDTVSSATDIVVSSKLEGQMVESALAINRPVVNVQWLNDILFGAQMGIKNPTNDKYQQFNLVDPFFVNYDMISHLMDAWKTPVIFLKDPQVYDLTTSPDSPSKRKRQKTTNEDPELIDLVGDDDDDDDDLVITYVSKNLPNKPLVVFCGFTVEEENQQKQVVLDLGGKIATLNNEGTHLVMKKPLKTNKFLCCLTSVNHIIDEYWLKDSRLFSKFQDEGKYSIKYIFDDNNTIVCYTQNILTSSIYIRQQLCQHMTFFISPNIKFPPLYILEEMIKSAGGKVEITNQTVWSTQKMSQNTYIISCLEDLHLIDDKMKINYDIYSPEFVTNILMKHRVEKCPQYVISSAVMKSE